MKIRVRPWTKKISQRHSTCKPYVKEILSFSCCSVAKLHPTLLRPGGLGLTRLLSPWDSPGKNTGVGCHFLLQGDLPIPGMEPESPVSPVPAERFFITEPPGKPRYWHVKSHSIQNLCSVEDIVNQIQRQSHGLRERLPRDGLVGAPCSPRDSQESSPTLQFKSSDSSVLSFLYSPTLTSKPKVDYFLPQQRAPTPQKENTQGERYQLV